MTSWQKPELDAIERADDLRIAPLRPDGSARAAVPIWVVRVGDGIFVRSFRGNRGAWYRHAVATGVGRIEVPGLQRDVTFETPREAGIAEQIDGAYQRKYGRYGDRYLRPMLDDAAKAATLRLEPRDTNNK